MLSRLSRVRLLDPVNGSTQAPLFMGFSRQERRRMWLCPPPGDLPYPAIEPLSLTYPALAGRFFTTSATWEVPFSDKGKYSLMSS